MEFLDKINPFEVYKSWRNAVGIEHSFLGIFLDTSILSVVVILVACLIKNKKTRLTVRVLFLVILWVISFPAMINKAKTPYIEPGTKIHFALSPRNSKFFLRTDAAILKDAKMRLGIVPFEGNKLLDSNQFWISSKRVTGDPLLYSFDFPKSQIAISTKQVTMAFLIIESNSFQNGFMPLVFYSWNYTEGKDWVLWKRDLPDNIFNSEQSDEVQRFLDKINSCMQSHSKDKRYNECFKVN